MKKSIYKYEIEMQDISSIELPKGYEILTAQNQDEKIMLWAIVDPEEIEKETVEINIFGTGHAMFYGNHTQRKYISTVQLSGGNYIIHVFQRIKS